MLTFKLKKRLRHFTVDISQQIGTETLVLIGHSGCGKSTALKMLAGLVSPDEGKLQLNDHLLVDKEKKVELPPEERNIGFVFQNYALFPHLTVEENVAYGISPLSKTERDERVREAIILLGIEKLAQSKPAMLSGGEQQRVALARALVTRPKLLLLDEPLSALDVSTRSYVRAELKELLHKLSIPCIVVTHDYEDARVLADRVAVMDQGKIIQTGTPKEIAQFPANHFVAEFTGTNLVPLEKSESLQFVAFDPWRVEIDYKSCSSPYEWKGRIRDMAWSGGFVRLYIEGQASLYADISVEQCEREGFKIGDEVFATVQPEQIRNIVTSSDTLLNQGKDKQKANVVLQKAQSKWKYVTAIVSLLAITVFATAFGFGTHKEDKKVQMFALVAANATDPFNELIQEFNNKHPGTNVEATYAGTQVIRTQLEQGTKADLFLSADLDHIEAIKKGGYIDQFYPVSNNHEVIVVPKDNRAVILSLEDLGSKPLKLVIGTDTVPIGRYTRMVFNKAKAGYGEQFPEKVISHVVSYETNTKAVLQKVSLGEADAGVVYRTDVTPEFLKKVEIIEIPKDYNVTSTNYIAVPKKAPNLELAQEFMKMMLSEQGQSVFLKYDYDPLK